MCKDAEKSHHKVRHVDLDEQYRLEFSKVYNVYCKESANHFVHAQITSHTA